jgi:hypothetical protein
MILDEIAEKTRARVEEDKKNIPFVDMRNEAGWQRNYRRKNARSYFRSTRL